jgi:hypothetical protein
MRLLRVLTAAIALAALLPRPGAAQEGRPFKDAWFWGIKGGGQLYSSATTEHSIAPSVGADWLITRSRAGLYLSFDQAFLSTTGQFLDRDTDSSFFRPVELKNVRRFQMAAMVFPMQTPRYHPYFGLGLGLNQIGSANFSGSFTTPARYQVALDSVQSKKTSFSPTFIGGLQVRNPQFSLFGQVVGSPTQQRFFLTAPGNGNSVNFSFEGGIRYNVGSSIDRVR